MRSGLLRHSIKTLRLRADAPFPGQLTNRMRRWLRVVIYQRDQNA